MAQQLYFSRDTKVYFKIGAAIWEVPVLDGFSFSQATNSSEIVLAEMESTAGVSRRGKRVFNDSLAPAEWSMSTYSRPFVSAGSGAGAASNAAQTRSVEEVLWALLAGPAQRTGFNWVDDNTLSNPNEYFTWDSAGTTLTIDFDRSNRSTLGTASIIFAVGDANKKYYEVTEAVVNEASIDFDIDGIATINWSGFGARIQETTAPTATIYEAITNTDNFIRNRLTTLVVDPNNAQYASGALQATYDLTLTGGNITISNNITYITPEEIGFVNYPIGHVTGNRSISGNFTSYLTKEYGTGAVANKSSDLWEDLSALTSTVTHSFHLKFQIGGASGVPRFDVDIPTATIEIPTHAIEDIIALETAFTGLPSSIDATDECTIVYYAQP
jgi:hypothetical protein